MQVAVDGLDVLTIAIVVIFLGRFLTTHIAVLERYHILPTVTGGLLCSIVTALVNVLWDVEITFDLALRDLLLLFFFSTIGLSAKLRLLVEGGKTIAILVVVARTMLVLQNLAGVGVALLFEAHPAYGLFAGSVSFAGGPGTAIAWGAEASAAGLQGAAEFGVASAILIAVMLQALVTTLVAIYFVFRLTGRNYDSAVMASGFAGLGLGATPVAIANMNALTNRYGPSPKAYLVIPLIGAFFVDLMNALVIKFFLAIPILQQSAS